MHISELNEKFWLVTAEAPKQLSVFSQKENTSQKIINFGSDNQYPQEILRVNGSSPIATACLDARANYTAGDGLYMVDSEGKNVDDLFSKKILQDFYNSYTWEQICYSWAWFEAAGIKYKFDLNGKIVGVSSQEFSTVRLGMPDEEDHISYAMISPSWSLEKNDKKFKAKKIDLWNKDFIQKKIQEFGVDAKAFGEWTGALHIIRRRRPGQIYYPNPKHASALGWAYVDGKIQLFHSTAVDNSFSPGFILYIPFSLDGVDENGVSKKVRMREEVKSAWMGAENAGEPAMLYGPNKDAAPQIIPFTNNGNDKLYLALQDLITKNICIANSVPPVLANIPIDGGLNTNKEYIINEFDKWLNTDIKRDQARLLEGINSTLPLIDGYVEGYKLMVSNSRPLAFIPNNQLSDYTEAERRESNGYAPKETEVLNG